MERKKDHEFLPAGLPDLVKGAAERLSQSTWSLEQKQMHAEYRQAEDNIVLEIQQRSGNLGGLPPRGIAILI